MARVTCAVFMLLMAGAPGVAHGQLPPERRLAPANARLSEDFVSITSVRELRDGRVFVTDPRGDRFVLADFAADRLETIGRKGRGPGEYDFPAPLVALAGDSTAMILASSRRWLMLDGPRVVATLPPDAPVVRDGLFLNGADYLGRVLTVRGERTGAGITNIGPGDSSYLILADRRTGAVDTVGQVRRRETRIEAEADANGRIIRSQSKVASPLSAAEPARLFLDGWIAVVRREPYRVDWRTPEGRWVRGPALPFTRVRVDRREREAAVRYDAEQTGGRHRDPDFFDGWPEHLPPYTEFRLYPIVPTPEGHIAIRRTRSTRQPEPRYDIVDRRGVLVDRLVLGPGEAIVGFGTRHVYVVRTEEDGANWLSRHPWRQ